MMDTASSVVAWLSLLVSLGALLLSWRAALYQHLTSARLEWQRPLVFSLDDERKEQECKHPPAIAIALTVHNAGAQPGIVRDIAVGVTKLGDSRGEVFFQARKMGASPKYVTVFQIEEHARPTTPIVIEGHRTETIVVQFEERSNIPWSWRPGRYAVRIYSLNKEGQWTERTSFGFTLTEEDIDRRLEPARVTPCQRWTDEVLASRDALIEQSSRSKKRRLWMFRRKRARN